MKVLIALLIVFALVGLMLVPIAEAYVETETDNVVGTLSDESVSFAAAWANALRMANKMWGSDVTGKLLSNESLRCKDIYFRVEIHSNHNRNGVMSLDSGTVLMSAEMNTIAQIQLAFVFYESLNEIFNAFKERSEREFG